MVAILMLLGLLCVFIPAVQSFVEVVKVLLSDPALQ